MSARARKILRVVWLPLLGAVLAGALAGAAGRTPQRYEASLLLVVPASGPVGPVAPPDGAVTTTTASAELLGRPSEAQRLAGTYATLIPADTATLEAVAGALGRPLEEVRGMVTATAVSDSSLIGITVEGRTADEAALAAEALGVALTGRPPASPAVAPGSLILVSTDEPDPVGGLPSGAVPSAALAGALLGGFAAVAWTRQDRRVDGASDVDPLDLPTIEIDEIDGPNARAAVAGVLVASGLEVGDETPVHLLAAGRRSDALTTRLAAVLPTRLGQLGPPRIRFPGSAQPTHLGPNVLYGGPVSGTPSPTALAQPGVAVLVVRRGTRLAEVARSVATIERFGSVVAGVLVCGRDAGSGTGDASRSAVAEEGQAALVDRADAAPGAAEPAAGGLPHRVDPSTGEGRAEPTGSAGSDATRAST